MADAQAYDSKLTPEGRMTLPKAVRQQLDAAPGTVLRILVTKDGVQLVNPDQLLMQVWANNTGGDAGDSGEDVRTLRDADAVQAIAGECDAEEDMRSEEQVTADLLSALGISA
jgi:AbrB family looped-hinge helix DNA binding protein